MEPQVDLVVSGADVDLLNTAIVGAVNQAPADRHARMLYERWARFAASPLRQRPEAELEPVLRAFASAYAACKRGEVTRGVGRIDELAGAPVSMELAGKQLDLTLARAGQFSPQSGAFMRQPWVLVLGGVLAWKVLRKKKVKR